MMPVGLFATVYKPGLEILPDYFIALLLLPFSAIQVMNHEVLFNSVRNESSGYAYSFIPQLHRFYKESISQQVLKPEIDVNTSSRRHHKTSGIGVLLIFVLIHVALCKRRSGSNYATIPALSKRIGSFFLTGVKLPSEMARKVSMLDMLYVRHGVELRLFQNKKRVGEEWVCKRRNQC